jgi:hypothetical protein
MHNTERSQEPAAPQPLIAPVDTAAPGEQQDAGRSTVSGRVKRVKCRKNTKSFIVAMLKQIIKEVYGNQINTSTESDTQIIQNNEVLNLVYRYCLKLCGDAKKGYEVEVKKDCLLLLRSQRSS